MESKRMKFEFDSSITNIENLNPSFAKGVIRIAYHGKNRNGSIISKEVFEKAIPSMFNCPVVGHFMRDKIDENGELGDFGGHDGTVIEEVGGDIKYIIETTPLGVVPESAKYWWEVVQEENGEVHEYLNTECILWKRQEGFEKIKEKKTFKHSMEITVNDGEFDNEFDFYRILDFTFEAFCILGSSVEPCFESSTVSVFALDKDKFKNEFELMLKELKKSIKKDGGEMAKKNFEEEKENKVIEEETIAEKEGLSNKDENLEVDEEKENIEENKDEKEVSKEEKEDNNKTEENKIDDEETKEEQGEDKLNIQEEYDLLKSKFEEQQKELERLREFEKEVLAERELLKKNKLLDEYSILLSEDDVKLFKEKINDYSFKKLEIELSKLFVKKSLEKAKENKKFSVKEIDEVIMDIPKAENPKSKYAC